MKDEFNNEAPYDFKNILFARMRMGNYNGTNSTLASLYTETDGTFGVEHFVGCPFYDPLLGSIDDLTVGDTTAYYFYTFSWVVNYRFASKDYDEAYVYDASLNIFDGVTLVSDINSVQNNGGYFLPVLDTLICNNVIKEYFISSKTDDSKLIMSQGLNDIVIISSGRPTDDTSIQEVKPVYNNYFGVGCSVITLGFGGVCGNTFEGDNLNTTLIGSVYGKATVSGNTIKSSVGGILFIGIKGFIRNTIYGKSSDSSAVDLVLMQTGQDGADNFSNNILHNVYDAYLYNLCNTDVRDLSGASLDVGDLSGCTIQGSKHTTVII